MVDDLAERVCPADSLAGLHALPAGSAGQVQRAVAVLQALRPAVGRVADEALLARADAGAVHHLLHAVGAALVVAARIRLG